MKQDTTLQDMLDKALALYRNGDMFAAKSLYLDILRASPASSDALHHLGVLAFREGDYHSALNYLQRAVRLDSSNEQLLLNLASLYRSAGQSSAAQETYHQYLRFNPDNAYVHKELGDLYRAAGDMGNAISRYRHAIGLKPDYREALLELGGTCHSGKYYQEAIQCYQEALKTGPAARLASEVHNNLGTIYNELHMFDKAEAGYREALRINPGNINACINLGHLLKRQERIDEAIDCLRRASTLDPANKLHRLQVASLCPTVFDSRAEIDRYRDSLMNTLGDLSASRLDADFAALADSGLFPPFGLMYHGENDRPVKEAYANVFKDSFPDLHPGKTSRAKIGIVVTRAHEGIFLRSMRGVLNHIATDDFELVIVCAEEGAGRIRARIRNRAIRVIKFPAAYDQMIDMIRQENFSILYYWEVASDSLNYFLPFLRLAPVQCTSWGIQVTTGIPAMDYYLSSSLVEADNADQYYSEKLVRASTLLTYQYREPPPDSPRGREYFGLGKNQHIYLFAHQIGKFHPDFDYVVAGILRRDESAVVAVTRDRWGNAADRLRARLEGTIPDVAGRIVFVPRQSHDDYRSLLQASDVLLDPLYYGGVNATYDGFALGKPIVTMATDFHIGRYTYGCYKKMGVTGCIAAGIDEYIDISVRTGMDADYRDALTEEIMAASAVLYEDMEAVHEHERIFRELTTLADQGLARAGPT
jgi:predicted O-linked N-acetylglucosamine transferase (SPINDLY family)